MRRFTLLMLFAITGLAAAPLHASTILTVPVVFTVGGFTVAGASATPVKSSAFAYNPIFEEVAFYFQPGTYRLTSVPVSPLPIVSASYTLSQSAPAMLPISPIAPPPAITAVTPEPSTFAPLGSGCCASAA